ncbi:MAG: hypothetical protein JWM81_526 [Candidatus Saccharibacteria bacterium]|nr:hypothetical protein [Candidatus Saccharibacteria bacterium]
MAALKAELRKLFMIRSTYVLSATAVIIIGIGAGYANGFKLTTAQLHSPLQLQGSVVDIINLVSIFPALIGILLMTHEYRYNTILYSLTSNRSRTKFLAAKFIALSIFAIVFILAAALIAALFSNIGAHIAGHSLVTQSFAYSDTVWRIIFGGWGYAVISLLIATLVRNQIAAVVSLFIIPSTVEGLLSLLLRDNTIYLPFNALNAVLTKSPHISYGHAALTVTVYLFFGWLIAWILFLRRDAN